MSVNGRYVKLATKFWTDEKTAEMDTSTKLLYLYILSSPHSNMAGYYRLPKAYIKADLKLSDKEFTKGFNKLLDKGLIKYCEKSSVILVLNYLKYNKIQNNNQAVGAANRTSEIPKNTLVDDYKEVVETYADNYEKELMKGLPKQLDKAFGNTDTDTELDTELDTDTELEGKKTSSSEREILKILKSVPKYPFDYSDDLEHIRELSTDYPTVDMLNEIKKWRTYKKDKPLKENSNARLQLRNWIENAYKWADDSEDEIEKDYSDIVDLG